MAMHVEAANLTPSSANQQLLYNTCRFTMVRSIHRLLAVAAQLSVTANNKPTICVGSPATSVRAVFAKPSC